MRKIMKSKLHCQEMWVWGEGGVTSPALIKHVDLRLYFWERG